MTTNNTAIFPVISSLVAQQFPDFYHEEGPNFVAFVKAYYEWLEDEEQMLYYARRLFDYDDVDTTLDDFLLYFKRKYLHGIPDNILGDKRFLIKHILDLYRAKGTDRGYKLLFRLLYNEDVEIYYPATDIFRASDGEWVKRDYLELTESEITPDMIGLTVVGYASGATAIAETYVKRIINGRIITTLYISNRLGTFEIGERVATATQDVQAAPSVIGSLATLTVTDGSSAGHSKGDLLTINSDYGIEGIAVISSTRSTAGAVEFTLVDGGTGYTTNATIVVTPVGTGSDAMFEITEISNTEVLVINTDYIEPYANVLLSEINYGFPASGNESLSTLLYDAFSTSNLVVGTIASIRTLNTGSNYNISPTVTVRQEDVIAQHISDGAGNLLGNNAIVTALASTANNLISTITVKGSGFGYLSNEAVTLNNISNTNAAPVSVTVGLGGVGVERGEFVSTRGFSSSDKYLQDSYYYQEFSYETRVGVSLERYSTILREIIHPAGVNLFGNWKKSQEINLNIHVPETVLTIS